MRRKKSSQTAAAREFLKISKTLWGKRWRIKSAEALHVDPTTVWRWMQEGDEPPTIAMIALRSMYHPVDGEQKQG